MRGTLTLDDLTQHDKDMLIMLRFITMLTIRHRVNFHDYPEAVTKAVTRTKIMEVSNEALTELWETNSIGKEALQEIVEQAKKEFGNHGTT
jgi:hypothetical protein